MIPGHGGHGRGGRRTDGAGGARRGAQPTVLVSSPEDGLARAAPTDLLADRVRPGDGVVVVATRGPPTKTADRVLDAVDALHPASVSVVGTVEQAADAAVSIDAIGPRPDPAALAAAVQRGFDAVDGGRTHLLVDALAAPAVDDVDPVYRRAHEVAMAVGARPGLALFAVETSGLPARFVDRLTHLFDIHLRLRTDGDRREAQWTALTGDSDGWRCWSEVELRLGATA